LYSYLADSSFVFLDKSEVVSTASLVRGAILKAVPLKNHQNNFAPLAYYALFEVRKEDDGNIIPNGILD
jgi:hypothetical protein